MSRSYKKHPVYTDGRNGQKKSKRYANKKVRHSKNVPNGKYYKRYFCSYDIHDYVSRWTWKEALESWEQGTYSKGSLKDFYRYWLIHYKNK